MKCEVSHFVTTSANSPSIQLTILSVGTRRNASTCSPFNTVPPEVLLNIFKCGIQDDAFYVRCTNEPFFYAVETSTWKEDMSFKRTIVLVCRSWRDIGMRVLYEHVHLHSIGQLCALVKTLEESLADIERKPASVVSAKTTRSRQPEIAIDAGGYGRWIQHVHCHIFIPRECEDVYVKLTERFFILCRPLLTVSWCPYWRLREAPSIEASFLHILGLDITKHSSRADSLRHLSLTLDIVPTDQKLHMWMSRFDGVFKTLESLTCDVVSFSALKGLGVVACAWAMPKLEHLAVRFSTPTYIPSRTSFNIFYIRLAIKNYGSQLLSFELDSALCVGTLPISLEETLRRCPRLKHFKLSTYAFESPAAKPHGELEDIEIFEPATLIQTKRDIRALNLHLTAFAKKELFPNVRSILALRGRKPRNVAVEGSTIHPHIPATRGEVTISITGNEIAKGNAETYTTGLADLDHGISDTELSVENEEEEEDDDDDADDEHWDDDSDDDNDSDDDEEEEDESDDDDDSPDENSLYSDDSETDSDALSSDDEDDASSANTFSRALIQIGPFRAIKRFRELHPTVV